ncbi:MAG: aminotransferase DegT [Candidatus Brocadiaceae bacterium]|nr:aminotransferase DegT [Candidatus Brocadiaceae bacterium]
MSFFCHIPPSAAPIYLKDIVNGIKGLLQTYDYLSIFREGLKEHFHAKNVFLVSSGKAAITIILNALFRNADNANKDEVIIPAYTCYSVPASIIKAGLKVKLCDIDKETLDFNYSLLSDAITERTLAIIPCNLFGIPSDIKKMYSIIAGRKIYVIDDAAQAMGISTDGRMAGTRGDIGLFSLDRGKNLTTVEGGIIITDRADIAGEVEKILSTLDGYTKSSQLILLIKAIIISLILRPFLYWIPANIPGLGLGKTLYPTQFLIKYMSNTQAGLAWNWQEKLTKFNIIRKENTKYYYEELYNVQKISCLNESSEVTYNRFPVVMNNFEEIQMDKMSRLGISKMYPDSIDHIPELNYHNIDSCPVAFAVSKKLLCLPSHIYIKKTTRQKIVKQLKKLVNN